MTARSVAISLVLAAAMAAPCAAARKARHPHSIAPGAPVASASPPIDDLYRRRGYGQGGLVFGGGSGGRSMGGTSMAGACADVAFARPLPCEPASGYGLYGNGLGYPFGF